MPVRARPLSPHLQVYRWQIGNTLSIIHRMTGVALSVGLLALAYWLVALAGGEEAYESARHLLGSPIGLLLLAGWSLAFFYHLFNGLRHLFWDAGRGFERTQRYASGWAAVIGALVATAALWLIAVHGVNS